MHETYSSGLAPHTWSCGRYTQSDGEYTDYYVCNDVSLILITPRPPADKTVLDPRDWISWAIDCIYIGGNCRSAYSHVMDCTCYDVYIVEMQPRTRERLSCVWHRGNAIREFSPLGPPYSRLFPSPRCILPFSFESWSDIPTKRDPWSESLPDGSSTQLKQGMWALCEMLPVWDNSLLRFIVLMKCIEPL